MSTEVHPLHGGGGRGSRMPPNLAGAKYLHFHAVYGENWSNSRLVPPSPQRLAPLGKYRIQQRGFMKP